MEKLGINPLVIIFQIANFAILVFLLNKLLYKRVLKAIKDKREALEKIELDKKQLEVQKENLLNERRKVLEMAREEKRKILAKAQEEIETAKKEVIKKAQEEAKRIIEKVERELTAEKARLAKDYEKDVLSTSVSILEKVIEKKDISKIAQIKATLMKELR